MEPLVVGVSSFDQHCIGDLKQLKETSNCNEFYYAPDILRHALEVMEMPHTLVDLRSRPLGEEQTPSKENNFTPYSGVLGDIYQGRVDTVLTNWVYTAKRWRYFDFAYPIEFSASGYIYHREYTAVGNLFTIFKMDVWIAFLVTFGLASIAFTISQLIMNQLFGTSCTSYKSTRRQINDGIWTLVTMVTDQYNGSYLEYNLSSARIIFGSFGLLVIFLFSLYQSSLLSSLLDQKSVIPFTGTADLARLIRKGQYKMILSTQAPYYIDLVKNNPNNSQLRSAFTAMNETWKVNPPLNLDERVIEDERTKILSQDPKLVMPLSYDSALYDILAKYCHLTAEPDRDFGGQMASFIFRKGHPIVSNLSEQLNRNEKLNAHLVRKFRIKKRHSISKSCGEKAEIKGSKGGRNMDLEAVKSMMWFFGFGALAGFLQFGLECWWKKFFKPLLLRLKVLSKRISCDQPNVHCEYVDSKC